MNAPFPFGFPGPTAFYLALYVLFLLVHVVFMHYVLGGAGYLAVRTLRLGNQIDRSTLAALLREWMPFQLSAAITAGIAPLLFAQVLYPVRFYSANILLYYRWLAILPALIGGFYLLYLLKTDAPLLERYRVRLVTKLLVLLCFGYVAWLWTTNHLLSVQSLKTWTEHYASGEVMYRTPEAIPRLAVWILGAIPTLALWLGWQLVLTPDPLHGGEAANWCVPQDARHVVRLALAGLGLTAIAAIVYFVTLPATDRASLTGPLARPWLAAAIVGAITQGIIWGAAWNTACLGKRRLIVLTLIHTAVLAGVIVVREALRLGRIDMSQYYASHEHAAGVSGRGAFFVMATIHLGLIGYCAYVVRTRRERQSAPPGERRT